MANYKRPGRPRQDVHRKSHNFTIREDVFVEYEHNCREFNEDRNKKIERFMTEDNLRHRDVQFLREYKAEILDKVEAVQAIILEREQEDKRANSRGSNVAYQKELYNKVSELKRNPNDKRFIDDIAKQVSKRFSLPFSVVKKDLMDALPQIKHAVSKVAIAGA